MLNKERGVLAAVAGNPATAAGIVDLYDISQDCRAPVLKSSTPMGVLGHESGFAPDGNTFYSASPAGRPSSPSTSATCRSRCRSAIGNVDSHGLSLSDDGNRAYVAGTGLRPAPSSTRREIQSRAPNPSFREIASLTWDTMSIPQNTIPFTIDGHAVRGRDRRVRRAVARAAPGGSSTSTTRRSRRSSPTCASRSTSRRISRRQAGDNGAQNPVRGYAGHYCNIPTRVDPAIVACSMILSGLRVFDIRDPHNPREIAYFNAPIEERIIPPSGHQPARQQLGDVEPDVRARAGEIWYSDGFSGFYNVRLTNGAWPGNPAAGTVPDPAQTPATKQAKKGKKKCKKAKKKRGAARSAKCKRKKKRA